MVIFLSVSGLRPILCRGWALASMAPGILSFKGPTIPPARSGWGKPLAGLYSVTGRTDRPSQRSSMYVRKSDEAKYKYHALSG
jgi:hypothetical protein